MLAVGLSYDEAKKLIKGKEDKVSVGAVNGPAMVALSGDTDIIEQIADDLNSRDIFHRILQVNVPFHSHPNEQAGYVISGKIRLKFAKYDEILIKGDSYVIPENQAHSLTVIEAGEVIDVFTPPREDYR